MQLSYNPFGEGTSEILLDNVNCLGNETSLADCQHRGWGVHNCGHHEDVAIKCVDNLAITGTVTWKWASGRIQIPAKDLMIIC